MKLLNWCLFLLVAFSVLNADAGQHPRYQEMEDGVIVYPDESFSGGTRAVRLQVINDHIIRVIATPGKEFPPITSLIAVPRPANAATWNLVPGDNKEKLTIRTRLLTANADLRTGAVNFRDVNGQVILAEKLTGRHFYPTVSEGSRTFRIRQQFQTTPDDAWYGLGQHHDGAVNYRGDQVFLFQNNTEVAVPFLVSKKNYGILWDNNSISVAGDTRTYKELSALKLVSSTGEQGWLTTTYINSRTGNEAVLRKPESSIRYEFLNDSKLHLPAEFKPADGRVMWEGTVASEFDGIHKFRLTYGGYIKIWMDEKLVLDRWRVCWNPSLAIIDAPFRKNVPVKLRIEWIPDGGESYLSMKWLEPPVDDDKDAFGFDSESGQQLDYYFIYGSNSDEVISGFRQLTGKATILPIWTFGFWQSRERYKTQDEILQTVQEFRKRKIGLDNIVLDWSYWKEQEWGSQEFEAARFPNPDSMISVLHKKYNTRFTISVWPKFYEGIKAYEHFQEKGWLYKRNVADRQRDWIAKGYVSTFYDAFNPDAQKGFWKLLSEKLYHRGIDGWWMDASEPDILSNVSPQKRKEQMSPVATGLTSEYLNAYPLVNAQGIYEGQRAEDPNKRVFILTRSAFPGIQRYAAATWSGDIASRWHDMRNQISAGINFSLSGLPYWSMDIGGFAVERRFEKPNPADLEEWRELNARWYQFGAFVPLFRVHGQFPFREIYNVSPEGHASYNSMTYYNKLRYRLLPYIYSTAARVYHEDYTIMRGLVMDFAADSSVTDIADQYMFGSSLLVNPVYTQGALNRSVYLPAGGGWYDMYDGKYFQGKQTITAEAPYERMPVFVKAGAIIPTGPDLQYTQERKADTLLLHIYAGQDGHFRLYEDDGLSYGYERGESSVIDIHYDDKLRQVIISDRKGSFPGMLKKRNFLLHYITPARPSGIDQKPMEKTIRYTGKKKTINLHN